MNMTCAEWRDLINDYLDEGLEEARKVVFESHRTVCVGCGAFIECYQVTVKVGRRLPACTALPADTEARLRAALAPFLAPPADAKP